MKKNKAYLFLLPGLVFLLLFMIVPIILTISSTFKDQGQISFNGYIEFFKNKYFIQVLMNTLKVSLMTTLLCIVISLPVSYYISRIHGRMKSVLIALSVFPLLTSAIVRSFSWMIILGKNGLLNEILMNMHVIREPLNVLYTPTSMIIGLVHLFLPLMIISLVGVMENISDDLVQAAESLGASRFVAFRKIIFPLCVPGLIVGSILVFVGSLTAYTTPALLGGKQQVISVYLYQNAMTLNDWHAASIVATIMVAVTFVIVGLMNLTASKLNPRGENS
ncbi:ABC transporter permease [Sporolactobacillus sp. THM7-4]|nr:ABC transporter permease [Sporolactobacillus sp. THM7-4]